MQPTREILMRCRDAEDLLARYADDALPPPQSAAVASHLDACGSCRRELQDLQRSLRALNAAAPGTAPDLWSRFQAQLGARSIAGARHLTCDSVRSHLAALVDGALDPNRSAAIREHLASCAPCAAEEAVHVRSLASLQSVGAAVRSGRAPDLWSAFTARVSDTVPCRTAQELLPAWLDGELAGSAGSGLTLHLEHCGLCTAEAERLQHAVAVLDRVGAKVPEVDLWPAFAQRLRAEEERGSKRPLIAAQRWAAWLWAGGMTPRRWAPVLAVPVAALAMLMGLRLWTGQESRAEAPVTVAQSSLPVDSVSPLTGGEAQPNTKAVTPSPERTSSGAQLRVKRSGTPIPRLRNRRTRTQPVRARRPSMMASRLRPRSMNAVKRTTEIVAAGSDQPSEAIRLAAGGSGSIGAPAEVNSEAARDQVMPEFLQAVTLLVGAETATTHPFEIDVNAH